MLLDVTEAGEPGTYRLVGELDISTVDMLDAVLQRAAAAGGDVKLDLSQLTFIDSSGIRVLIRAMDRLHSGEKLILSQPTAPVQQVLDLMGLEARDELVVLGGPDNASTGR